MSDLMLFRFHGMGKHDMMLHLHKIHQGTLLYTNA